MNIACIILVEVMHIRTTINLEKDELSLLLHTTHLKNKSKAIRIAVDEFLRKEKLKKIDALRGTLHFDEKVLEERHRAR